MKRQVANRKNKQNCKIHPTKYQFLNYKIILTPTGKKNQVRKWAKDIQRHFLEENILMPSKHMNRCSTSAAIREMQIKTKIRVSSIAEQTLLNNL